MSRKIVSAALLMLMSASAMAQMRGEGIFERADTDNDGSVTRAEFASARVAQFTKFDRNSDGYLDTNDVPKRLAARRKEKGGAELLTGQFDADGDGKVTKDEFVTGPTALFDRADADKNDVLDTKELAAAKQAAKAAADEWRSRRRQ
jgi:Ca2+-binding EF-hand superfamily protein